MGRVGLVPQSPAESNSVAGLDPQIGPGSVVRTGSRSIETIIASEPTGIG